MRETVIVGAVRTPVGKRNGGLSDQHAADLSAVVLNELIERTGVDTDVIDDVVWGCVSQVGDQSSNIGRYAVLAAGWPEHIPGTTVNRACGSSQQALANEARAQPGNFATADSAEAYAAFAARRDPEFNGRWAIRPAGTTNSDEGTE